MEQLIRMHTKQTIYYCPFQGTYQFPVPDTHHHTSEASIVPIDEKLRVFVVQDISPVTAMLKVLIN